MNQQYYNGLIGASLNPVQFGHLELLKISLRFASEIDIYLGKRNKNDRLPYEIRFECAKAIQANEEFGKRINIVTEGRFFDYTGGKYDVLITGSDLLNLACYQDERIRRMHLNHFNTFSNIVSVDRVEHPLIVKARLQLEEKIRLIQLPPISNSEARNIRKSYRDGLDISQMVPEYIWDIIKDHVEIFKS
jgi:nicotinic acid mononucleotide adenylyltransferase